MRSDLRVRSAGFTLVELLVAVAILAIVAVLGWRGLDSIVRARLSLNAELELTRGTQLSFAQLENDGAHLAGPELLPNRPTLFAADQRLVLIRTVLDEGQPTRLQIVAYRVNDGVLSRRESLATRDLPAIKALWDSALNDTDTLPVVALQKGVDSFAMRTWTFEENAWRVANMDAAAADASSKNPAPKRGLEVSLQLHGKERPLLKIFLLGAV